MLLSLVLFTSLLTLTILEFTQLSLRRQSLYVDVVDNALTNQYNLIRAVADNQRAWPTAYQLAQFQQFDSVRWTVAIQQSQPFVWSMTLANPEWAQRIIERQGGELVDGGWQRREPAWTDN